jgi:hypothetical protein
MIIKKLHRNVNEGKVYGSVLSCGSVEKIQIYQVGKAVMEYLIFREF